MLLNLRRSLVFAIAAIVLVFAYAYLGTGLSRLFFAHQAGGSITASGSTLIGQNWSSPAFFHGRPDDTGPYAASSTAPGGDNPLVANGHPGESAATNLGPRSAVLLQNTKDLVAYWHHLGVTPTPDLVTTSGSSYDPDITAADALAQIPMVSKATGISPGRLTQLIAAENHPAQLGFLGSSYLNVLQLNEALARLR